MASDTTGVGTTRFRLAATNFGVNGQAIFGYGNNASNLAAANNQSMTNIVSNAGVVATDTTGVGTARNGLAATSYGI